MKLELFRKYYSNKSTIGELYINGVFECYTLEDMVRPPGVKIAGQTAIPAERYRIIIDKSDRFKRLMPLLLEVLGFVGIRIHNGNTDKDTEGCILVGQTYNENEPDFIGRSILAFDALFKKLETTFNSGEEIWIEIIDTK
jgi:hypothetical protein